jgi:hypothetical protein
MLILKLNASPSVDLKESPTKSTIRKLDSKSLINKIKSSYVAEIEKLRITESTAPWSVPITFESSELASEHESDIIYMVW